MCLDKVILSQFQMVSRNLGGTSFLSCYCCDLLVKLMKYLLSPSFRVNFEANDWHALQLGVNTATEGDGKHQKNLF